MYIGTHCVCYVQVRIYGCNMVFYVCMCLRILVPILRGGMLFWVISCNKDSKMKGAAEPSPLNSQLTQLGENAFCRI